MRPALRLVEKDEVVVSSLPWWRAPWLVMTGNVVWWLVTFAVQLAVAVIGVALAILGGILMALGIMSHFVGSSK